MIIAKFRVCGWSVAMRRLLLVAVMCGAASGAQAADMPDLPFLRGSFTEGLSSAKRQLAGLLYRWPRLLRRGGHGLTNAGQDLLAKLLNNFVLETQFNISKWPAAATPTATPAALAASSATIRNLARPSSVLRRTIPTAIRSDLEAAVRLRFRYPTNDTLHG